MEAKQIDVNALPLRNSGAVPAVYCNNAETLIGPWDIRLVFSEVLGCGANADVEKELRANVVMSPAHARALAKALETALSQFEQVYGQIKMPEQPKAVTENTQ
jgi:hypothetical protein